MISFIEDGKEIDFNDPVAINNPFFKSTKRVLEVVFPTNKENYNILDLGCFHGGFTVEFAKMGFHATGIEARNTNYQKCLINKEFYKLDNLYFYKDDVWNFKNYGKFSAIYCGGLLHHLDRPREFINMISEITSKILIIQTHYAPNTLTPEFEKVVQNKLGDLTKLNGVIGRWYLEYPENSTPEQIESYIQAAWGNKNRDYGWVRSFWMKKEWILSTMKESGFDLVFEQFDNIGDSIIESMSNGYYYKNNFGTFIGVKTGLPRGRYPEMIIDGPKMPKINC
jgi:SAM-dependent methyltransferase